MSGKFSDAMQTIEAERRRLSMEKERMRATVHMLMATMKNGDANLFTMALDRAQDTLDTTPTD